MWYSILDFLNFAGVVTNAFLIAFTAQWSKDFTIYDKLWVVIAFEVSIQQSYLFSPGCAFNIFIEATVSLFFKNVVLFIVNIFSPKPIMSQV